LFLTREEFDHALFFSLCSDAAQSQIAGLAAIHGCISGYAALAHGDVATVRHRNALLAEVSKILPTRASPHYPGKVPICQPGLQAATPCSRRRAMTTLQSGEPGTDQNL